VPLIGDKGKWYFHVDAGAAELLARQVGKDELTAIGVCKGSMANASEPVEDDSVRQFASTLAKVSDTSSSGPFHGYHFRVISGDTGDRTIVAYPADYRLSGVMTFFCASDGSVYEKDLGPQTAKLAQQARGKLGAGWVLVQ